MSSIAGIPVRELAERYGTPLMVYDAGRMRAVMRQYAEAFRSDSLETAVAYASKAFLCKAMARLCAEEGMYLDVVSGGELFTALEAGFDAKRIVFHGNNKSASELRFALSAGIGEVAVDSLAEAGLLKDLADELQAPVHALLRVNPGIEAHTHRYIVTAHVDSKFGISLLNEAEILETVRTLRSSRFIRFDGLHAHIGSQIFEKEAFGEEIRKLFAFAAHLRNDCGVPTDTIDLGGGFAARYTAEDEPIPTGEICRYIIGACEEANAAAGGFIRRILIEPGRSIVAEAGSTVYTVGACKTTPGRQYLFVDGGMSDNIRPALYQAKYDAFLDGKEDEPAVCHYTVAGKCCESGDILIDDIALPGARSGDLLVMKTTGAYGYSMASNYNRLGLPAVVFAENGAARVVLRRQTYRDLLYLEEEETK